MALLAANVRAQDIDLIIVATSTPDMVFPSTACILQNKLGVAGCAAFDVQAVCSGFVYALTIVVIGGIGSVWGALAAALIVGFADTFGKVLLPELSGMVVYIVMAGVLLWRPEGIFKKG